MDVIKVSGTSRTSAVAGAIAGVFRENKRAEIQAIGAGAVNQAVKALVLSRGYLAEDGFEVVFYAEFTDVEIQRFLLLNNPRGEDNQSRLVLLLN
ncbi:MAG: stage V sporulation protein S [Anaerolineales bacterium]